MGPNEALENIRELLRGGYANDYEYTEAYLAASDAFEALDQWLCKGGFFPQDWTYGVSQEES